MYFCCRIQLILMKSLLTKFRNKKELPADSTCRNCKTQLLARYCHNCGQDFFAGGEKTVGEILYNTVDTVFAWDNKILKTLKYLIFYPGKLTKDFFAGKVVQYVYPAKLFWFITILFFASFNIGGHIDDLTSDDKELNLKFTMNDALKNKEEKDVPVQQEEVAKDEPETKAAPLIGLNEREKIIISTFKTGFTDYIPYVTFMLVPFFALLLFMLFYKKKKYYASHMIFALHFHSFVFLFFTVYILLYDFIPESWESVVLPVLFILPAVYFAIALYVAYRPSIPKLIWKIPFVMFTYGIASLTTLVLFILLLLRITEITKGIVIFE